MTALTTAADLGTVSSSVEGLLVVGITITVLFIGAVLLKKGLRGAK